MTHAAGVGAADRDPNRSDSAGPEILSTCDITRTPIVRLACSHADIFEPMTLDQIEKLLIFAGGLFLGVCAGIVAGIAWQSLH